MSFGTSVIFKSTDGSAPVLNLTAGSLKNLLKAVLVNGYGSTPSLGWTLEYESGNVAVFRMKGGTKQYIRIDDNNTVGSEYTDSICGFKTMFDVNNGTERTPTQGMSSWFRKRLGGTANVPWMIIGDDAGFYILTKPAYVSSSTSVPENLWKVCYYGDYIPFDIRNKWNFCILGSYNPTSNTCGLHKHGPTSNTNHFVQRDHSFKRGSVYCGVSTLTTSTYFGQGLGTPTGGVGTAGCKIGGNFITTPVMVYANMLDTNIVSSNCWLGALPGLSEPIMTDDEQNAVMSIDRIAPITITNADNYQLLLYIKNNTATSYDAYYSSSSKLVFKVGKGFRNV